MPRFRIATSLLLATSLSGCYGWRVESTPPAKFVAETKPERIQVIRTDRTKIELYNPAVMGDSLKGFPTELAIRPTTVPLSEVGAVATRQFSAKKTLGLAGLIVAGALIYDALMSLNQGSF
jgi:hypothetical protein